MSRWTQSIAEYARIREETEEANAPSDTLDNAALEPLLLEEYEQHEIDRFRVHIDRCIEEVNAELDFRNRVLDAYEDVGISIAGDKGAVMRAIAAGGEFSKPEMKKVFTVISKFGH